MNKAEYRNALIYCYLKTIFYHCCRLKSSEKKKVKKVTITVVLIIQFSWLAIVIFLYI